MGSGLLIEAAKYRLEADAQITTHKGIHELVEAIINSDVEGTILCIVPSAYEKNKAVTLFQNRSLCIVDRVGSRVVILNKRIYFVPYNIAPEAICGFRLAAVHIV